MDNQRARLDSNSDQWNEISQLINITQKLNLNDENIWKSEPIQEPYNFLYQPNENRQQPANPCNLLEYPRTQLKSSRLSLDPIKKAMSPQQDYYDFALPTLTIEKSKSDNSYLTNPQYFAQPNLQESLQYSPYLSPAETRIQPQGNAVLKLQVYSNKFHNLDRGNILNAFSKYGNLMDVVLDSKGLAYIFFSNVKSAKQAEFDFNRQYINENDTRLVVDFCNDLESNYAWGLLKQKKAPVLKTSSRSYQEPTATNPPGLAIATSPTYVLKFTCKYEIQIENDREFQVARRIIGSKGYNMKKIIELCQKKLNIPSNGGKLDFLKLRLRGRGSGFREGPENKESNEPLHLCISCKDKDVYQLARELVEELLRSIYQEYAIFCENLRRKYPMNLAVKCVEFVPNKENPVFQPVEFQPKKTSPQPYNGHYYTFEQEYVPENTNTNPQQDESKQIEMLIAAFIRARQEKNQAETENLSNQLKQFGISLF